MDDCEKGICIYGGMDASEKTEEWRWFHPIVGSGMEVVPSDKA